MSRHGSLAYPFLVFCGLIAAAASAHCDVKPAPEPVHVVSKQAGIDLTTTKVIHIAQAITPETEFTFMRELIEGMAKPGDYVILIDSPGGVVLNGAHMIQGMLAFKPPGVRAVCVVTGQAMSMAFNFLTHCDVRLAVPSGLLLAHKVAIGGVPMEIRLTSKVLRQIAKDLEHTDEPYRRANAAAMRMTLAQYDLIADNETIWTAPMLVAKHYLDGLAEVTGQ